MPPLPARRPMSTPPTVQPLGRLGEEGSWFAAAMIEVFMLLLPSQPRPAPSAHPVSPAPALLPSPRPPPTLDLTCRHPQPDSVPRPLPQLLFLGLFAFLLLLLALRLLCCGDEGDAGDVQHESRAQQSEYSQQSKSCATINMPIPVANFCRTEVDRRLVNHKLGVAKLSISQIGFEGRCILSLSRATSSMILLLWLFRFHGSPHHNHHHDNHHRHHVDTMMVVVRDADADCDHGHC